MEVWIFKQVLLKKYLLLEAHADNENTYTLLVSFVLPFTLYIKYPIS